ncbi:MAG TPA: hypothetical protein EYP65_05250 [Armatimonadetes bacterium]|nr:hypothetical protein [Armatimonadota bacterium]
MGPVIEHTNIVVGLMALHLLLSMAAVETRNLRAATAALVLQSATLAAIFGTFGMLWNQPWLYAACVNAFLTKAIFIPVLLFYYIRRLPEREVLPIIGFRMSVLLNITLVVILYHLFYTYMYLVAPTREALVDPNRSSLAMALVVFTLGAYVCAARRDVVKMVIGLVLLENGSHLAVVTLAPQLPETTLIVVASNVVIATWLLVYLSKRVYEILRTTDVTLLSRLRR